MTIHGMRPGAYSGPPAPTLSKFWDWGIIAAMVVLSPVGLLALALVLAEAAWKRVVGRRP